MMFLMESFLIVQTVIKRADIALSMILQKYGIASGIYGRHSLTIEPGCFCVTD